MARMRLGFAGTALGLIGLLGVNQPAQAQVPAYTLPQANLRAGPSRDFPLISLIPPGQPVELYGCVGGYGWCDVEVAGLRGWLSGQKLQVLYENRRVGLSDYAPRLALPVIAFSIGDYWGQYYQGRPFYGDRERWERREPAFARPLGPRENGRPEDRRGPRENIRPDDRRENDEHSDRRGANHRDDVDENHGDEHRGQVPPDRVQHAPAQPAVDHARPATAPQATPTRSDEHKHRDPNAPPPAP